MIEAEALLAALQRAQEGLTLKQLTAQLPDSGSRKPKLRPALRVLVTEGKAAFDGQRYHAATAGARVHPPSEAELAASAAQALRQAARAEQLPGASRVLRPSESARGPRDEEADEEELVETAAPITARPTRADALAHEHKTAAAAKPAELAPEQTPGAPAAAATVAKQPRSNVVAHEHKPASTVKAAAAAPEQPRSNVVAHEHKPSSAVKAAAAVPEQPRSNVVAHEHKAADAVEAAAGSPEQPRSNGVAQEHKRSAGHSPARAAAHAPHGHGQRGGAKTSAGKVPAALAEGIRLRKDAQARDAKGIGTADTRGAENWGTPREKAAPAPKQRSGELVGLIHLKAEGYGFVSPLLGASARDEDVFVPPGQTGSAIDGDIVKLRLSPGRDGRTIGEVVQIVEERRQLALGAYHLRGSREAFVEPHDRRMAGPIVVPRSEEYAEGELVKVQIKRSAGRPDGVMRGEVLGPLGARGEARYEILAAAFAQGFSDEFDAVVRNAAAALPDHVRPEDHAGRKDLRAMPLATIDGEDARDFDDAVFVEKSGDGYRLVVAIADVASYVHEDGPIDREALRRATSVYFPGTVLPMLPEQLSNGICSLNPDVERLCMVCDLQLDASGTPASAEVYPAVMKSHARLTYEQVAAVLEGKTPDEPRIAARVGDLKLAGELAKKMTAIRIARGALDFDLPEAKIILDDKGEVAEITSRPRNDAHRLVEEFMLAANEAVARFFSQQDLPTLYRVHDQPDTDKLEAFGMLASAHGFRLPERLTPRALGDLLKQLEGATAQRALTQLLLRAMMQAHYSPDDIGHYGLAAPTYLHFTSPIRRYPDLTVHRLLWKFWARDGKKQSQKEHDEEDAQLAGVGAQCSERERAAMKAERDVVSFYSAQFMERHVGEEFDATVTGVADLGLFCQLDSPAVEGLVPAESLGEDVRLDTALQRLTVGSSGTRYALGDSVRIRVMSADPARRRINFGIAGLEVNDSDGEHGDGPARRSKSRAIVKSENHGKPMRGGDAPAYSRAGKKGGDAPAWSRAKPGSGALAHEPRGFAPDRGFGKELARGLPKAHAPDRHGSENREGLRSTKPAYGKPFAEKRGEKPSGKGKPFGRGDERSAKPFSRSEADPRGAKPFDREQSARGGKSFGRAPERGGKPFSRAEADSRGGRAGGRDERGAKPFGRGEAERGGGSFARGGPSHGGKSFGGRPAPRSGDHHGDQAQQGAARSWGRPAGEQTAGERGANPGGKEPGWLREDDIAAQANSRPAPRPLTAGPPRDRTSSRGAPPPHRGQKPNRRR